MKKPIVIVIVGPTAVGKTNMAINIAKEFNAEILSADSRQFYKEISIGTAKPTLNELAEVKHHFVGHISIKEKYNASKFEEEALQFMEKYFKTKKILVVCGGSGMYINTLLYGFDDNIPTADKILRKQLNELFENKGLKGLQEELKKLDPVGFDSIDSKNPQRLLRAIEINKISGKPLAEIKKGIRKKRFFDTILIGLEQNRFHLYNRINQRVDQMIELGLIEEARDHIPNKELNALNTVGYSELFNHFDGEYNLNVAVEKIKTNSRRYAKRQLTWFKKTVGIEWFSSGEKNKILMYIRNIINANEPNS